MNHEVKKEETSLEVTQRITVENILDKVPVDELFGSVTTYPEGNDKNQSLRSSARVFKKIKLDANLNASLSIPNSSDKSEKKEEPKQEQLSKTEQKKQKPSWSPEDRALFFEALNEYGKDFENIHNYLVQKLKKKGVPDHLLITKDHVRHLYFKTWHKISKYLKFSEGTKKTVQELYGLINYGELRKKMVFTQTNSHKLNELIYHGCVTVRFKGKPSKVKTPVCAALRRLNKFDDRDDELKLPARVVVELRPRDMSSFLKVQSFALNPRIRSVLPLQKKLSTLITCISKRWRAAEVEFLKNTYPLEEMMEDETKEAELDLDARLITSQLRFMPPKGTKVNLPQVNLSDYFARESLCLKAFEERMGIERAKVGISSHPERKESKKLSGKARTDSCVENIAKSPLKSETQVEKATAHNTEPETILNLSASNNNISSSKETSDHVDDTKKNNITPSDKTGDETIDKLLKTFKNYISTFEAKAYNDDKVEQDSDISPSVEVPKLTKEKKEPECLNMPSVQSGSKTVESSDNNESNANISAEEQLNRLKQIEKGWTVDNCDTLTIGELYLMFGSSSKVVLEYHWTDKNTGVESNVMKPEESESKCQLSSSWKEHFGFTDALRKLVSLIKLQQRKILPKCPCGHVCSSKSAISKRSNNKIPGDLEEKSSFEELQMETDTPNSVSNTEESKQDNLPFDDFLKPQTKAPPVHLMAQLDSIQKLKPKYTVRKGRRVRAKQLVVERELPLTPKANSAHQIVRMNIISQTSSNSTTVSTTEELSEINSQTNKCEIDPFVDQILYNQENGIHSSDGGSGSDVVLDLGLNIPMEVSDGVPIHSVSTENLSVLLQDSSRSLSPSRILKENVNNWISSEVGDFSLSSFLGHLESPMKTLDDESNDVDSQVRSLLTENSFDYTAKFADLANKVTSDTAN